MATGTTEHPPIGIALLVVKNGRILFGKVGKQWHPPQSILRRRDKTINQSVERVAKSVGLQIRDVTFLCYKSWGQEPITRAKHSLYFLARWEGGNIPKPDGAQWEWFNPNLLPHPLFVSRHIFGRDTMREIRRWSRAK
jgi:hypothetical protein